MEQSVILVERFVGVLDMLGQGEDWPAKMSG